MATASTKATMIELPTRPAIRAHAGSGVDRLRLRMPSSRWRVRFMARLLKQAAITP